MKNLERKIFFVESKINVTNKSSNLKFLLNEMRKIGIESLPYSYTSLKKFIDSKTMNVHYNKHYKGYVEKLNKFLSKQSVKNLSLEEIIKSISKFDKKIRNNAGGAFNHALFWKMLSPTKKEINDELKKLINKNFGSIKNFKKEFNEVAKDVFGSGWVWLVVNKQGKLKIMSLPNQDNPLMNVIEKGGYPILGLDVWEHAYYLKYQNKRDEYINNFWDVINWDFVLNLYQKSKKDKKMITESSTEKSSKPCSYEDKELIRKLFNTNREIVQIYQVGIEHILKTVFPQNWYEYGQYSSNSAKGIYDFEIKGRSVLNKLNTNYNLFCVLYRDVNKVLKLENKPLVDVLGASSENKVNAVKLFLKKIYEYKDRIFSLNSQTFKTIMSTLSEKHKTGEDLENFVVKKLQEKFGEQNVKNTALLGSSLDFAGIDCIVKIDGKSLTGQIKPYKRLDKTIIDNTEYYVVLETGLVKNYKTDLLIFGNMNNSIYVFDNKKNKIVDGNFSFPIQNLLFKID